MAILFSVEIYTYKYDSIHIRPDKDEALIPLSLSLSLSLNEIKTSPGQNPETFPSRLIRSNSIRFFWEEGRNLLKFHQPSLKSEEEEAARVQITLPVHK